MPTPASEPTRRTGLLAGGLVVLVAVLGGSLYHLLSGDGSDGDADVVTHTPAERESMELPPPAEPKSVQFTHLTPQEKLKQKRLDAALQKIEWAKKNGERFGSMYKVNRNGEEVYIGATLGKGVGRNGEPLYATVEARRIPLGERRDRTGLKVAPKHEMIRLKKPITSLPNVTAPGKEGQKVMDYHKSGGKPTIKLPEEDEG